MTDNMVIYVDDEHIVETPPNRKFFGEIVRDEKGVDKDGNATWEFAVKPLGFDLKEGGAFNNSAKIPASGIVSLKSKAGAIMTGLKEVFGTKEDGSPYRIREGDYKGMRAEFDRLDIPYGKNAAGEEIKAKNVLVAVGPIPAEYATPASELGSVEFTQDEVAALQDVLGGQKLSRAKIVVMQRKADLPSTVVPKILLQRGLDYLVEEHYLSVTDGVIDAPAALATA